MARKLNTAFGIGLLEGNEAAIIAREKKRQSNLASLAEDSERRASDSPADRDKLQVLQEQLDRLHQILLPALGLVEKAQFEVQQMREKK